MFQELEDFLNANDLSLGKDVMTKLHYTAKHMQRIAKPDGKVPNIGDSGSQKKVDSFNWDSFHDEMSGFTVLKDQGAEMYLAFICGYSAKAHKHADDLSVLLNYRSKDFFIDSGKYNYGKNKFRSFVVSYRGHSSFSAGRPYSRPDNNRYTKTIATDHFLDAREIKLVSGYNDGVENAKLRRSVYALPGRNLILIRDQGASKTKENWTHRFVLSPEVEVEELSDGTVKLINGDTQVFLSWDGTDKPDLAVEHGTIGDSSVKAVVSTATNKVVKTTHLVYTHSPSQSVDAILRISLGSPACDHADSAESCLRVSGPDDTRPFDLPTFDF